ncbi:MAG: APC family permease [Parachlamydiaceae bacterium]|nr:APC family permease [Parachlamydiaceae bacterium]
MSGIQTGEYKLSLPAAILININIMLGAGIFINTPTLAKTAGSLGAFMYMIVGVLMLPLILSIAQLLRLHPSGGFYTFGQKEINPFIGFLSGWSYFTAKLASCMVMIHVSVTLIQHIFPVLMHIHSFILDFIIVCFFSSLNLLNIKAGSAIQKMFIGFKTFPIMFAILTGIFILQPDNFTYSNVIWDGLHSSLPLVIYAVIGFEAACSMSSKIKDAHKNAPLAVIISFAIVILIATLYQGIFYGSLGQQLKLCAGHCDTIPILVHRLFDGTVFANKFEGILHLAIASSTLGAAYGIIFSNSWNLHILAQNNHVWFSKLFTKFNKNLIPFACVLVEGVLCLVYLVVSQGVLIPLQQIGALGCVISYTFSIFALLFAIKNNPATTINRWIPLLGLASCAILLSACIRSFFINGMSSLIIFSALLLLGICMFKMKSRCSIQVL